MKMSALAVILFLLAACGGDSATADTVEPAEASPATTAEPETEPTEADHTDHTTATSEEATDTTASGESGGATINISGMSFGGPLTVSVGETIEIVNNDTLPHTWTDDDGAFNISLAPGDSATYTFDEAGEYSFFCELHPNMTGSITVEG